MKTLYTFFNSKLNFLISIVLISFAVVANNDSPNTNQINYTIYSSEYQEGRKKLDEFISAQKFTLLYQKETKNSFYYQFIIPQSSVDAIDQLCSSLGYVSAKKLSTFNNETRRTSFALELERLEQKKKEFEVMLVKIDSVKSDRYYSHWESIREIDVEIYNAKKVLRELESLKDQYYVDIELNDEVASPTNSKVNFVHMPGVEYVYFIPETPKFGTSFNAYQGVNLKYLFTKGKSYFTLGALKAIRPNKLDSTAYNEIFSVAFGQDWYSQNFGRGTRKFFNLYIGYQIGYALAYSQVNTKQIPFLSPETGIEIFKNKYFLFDLNMNYNLPIVKENRNLRGFRMAASLNFTF
jgi:hypothetical protein